MTVLITGGMGYIGSHTVVDLLEQGYDCLIVDNLSRSEIEVLNQIELIVQKKVPFLHLDLLDKDSLREVFHLHNISAVIHFAGYKSISESIENPLMYYQNNLINTLNLLDVMKEFGVKKFVFSSSATVYGCYHTPPLKEHLSLQVNNPYGRTKLMIEDILRDLFISDSSWSIVLMRYFNPIGAHPSGLIGEIPFDTPNNLMPHLLKVANGEQDKLQIFGGDYNTVDGSCIRDFIHIIDLSNGHVQALKYIEKNHICEVFNLGTGVGSTVLNLIQVFENANNVKIPYEIVNRRDGDISISVADVTKANTILGWTAKYALSEMCEDAWRWYKKNNKLFSNK